MIRHPRPCSRIALLLVALALLAGAGVAGAEIRPSSNVLVPWFEVALSADSERTTLLAVCNDADVAVDVMVSVTTTWGLPVIELPLTIEAEAVATINLRDWVRYGRLPGRTLGEAELAHVQAALSGRPSPRDNLYYGNSPAADLAVGAVTVRVLGIGRPASLWGDYFLVDPARGYAQGETLVDIDPTTECQPDCERHGVRFLEGGRFDAGTELVIWTSRRGRPSPTPEPQTGGVITTEAEVYDEAGRLREEREIDTPPIALVAVGELGLAEPFGWLELESETRSFIGVRFNAEHDYSVALHSYCLPEAGHGWQPGARLRLEKLTNGTRAGFPPGPSIPVGSPVTWEYIVTNTGGLPLADVRVVDDMGVTVTCPSDALAPGESMTCTASGTAEACQQGNVGTAWGTPPSGPEVSDRDVSHYFGLERAALDLEELVAGQDADELPGPVFMPGENVLCTFLVTNTGEVALANVTVVHDSGTPIVCPKTVLQPGESMTCTATEKATVGQHIDYATATGEPACGPKVSDRDAGFFVVPPPSGIFVKKHTNGQDADVAPGPILRIGDAVAWTYVVTNTGDATLGAVAVTDDKGVAVACPKTELLPGQSMTCTASGVVISGQYRNVGTATGTPAFGPPVAASDPSHYFGQRPAITLEKLVEGQEADVPLGPTLRVGAVVHWTYVVTNAGDVVLRQVQVTDDKGVAVTCPKTELAPGESMTCTATGTVVAGQYTNTGTATGRPDLGSPVSATDPASYLGKTAAITLEKLVQGLDADTPPGPWIASGQAVAWSYVVTNTGQMRLDPVAIADDQGIVPSCPKTVLQPGESMTCTATSVAASGPHVNIATATGLPEDGPPAVTATDPANYRGYLARIDVEKLTNGFDADTPTGPALAVGSAVTWTYVVTNSGDVRLTGVTVTDDRLGAIACPKTALDPAESMTCSRTGAATAGQYANLGTATGTPPQGPAVTDGDWSHYLGQLLGNQGCTPGYWKNHTDSWPPTGYSPSQTVVSAFASASGYPGSISLATLVEALGFAGGSGADGAAEILLRAGVAALLNAAHPGVAFPRTASSVLADVNTALATHDRDTMLVLAAALDADNNRGCPLN